MRLLFAHDHRFLTGPSGAVYTVGSFPRSVWQRYLGHFDHITVIARNGGEAPLDCQLARSDLPAVRFLLVEKYSAAERLLSLPGLAANLIAEQLTMADAVVARLPSDLGNLAAVMASRRGLPWAGEAVGCAADGYGNHGSTLARLYAPLAKHRMRKVTRQADQMLYVTRQFLQQRYPGPPGSVGVSDVEVATLSNDDEIGREIRFAQLKNGMTPVFGTIASLRVMSKGIQDALTAIARLRANGMAPTYRVLGAGDPEPWKARARAVGVEELVHFDGSRPAGASVRAWLSTIDVHLQPSYQEGLPRATVEAMSRGCACLGSTAGGLPELLPSERLHDPGDHATLARLMTNLIVHPERIEEAAHRDLRFSMQFQAAKLDPVRHRFYAELANRSRNHRHMQSTRASEAAPR